MRSALDQAITNSYAQQYPNAPQFAHNQNMYPSPFMAQNMPQQQPQQQSPSTYGQPYPTPGTPGYRPAHQARSASGSHDTPIYSPGMPAPSPAQALPEMDRRRTSASSKSSSHSPTGGPATPQSMHIRPALPQTSSAVKVKQESQTSQPMKAPPQHSVGGINGLPHTGPFTTSLPTEAQMLLGPALDPNDPFTSMLMAGSENLPQPYNYNLSPSTLQKPRSFNQTYDGMSATLAPSALDMSPRYQIYAQPPTTISASPTSSSAFQLPYDGSLPDFSKGQLYAGGNSAAGSGTVTPAGIDGTWDAFINDTSWCENTT